MYNRTALLRKLCLVEPGSTDETLRKEMKKMFNLISRRIDGVLEMVYGNELATKALNVAIRIARVLST